MKAPKLASLVTLSNLEMDSSCNATAGAIPVSLIILEFEIAGNDNFSAKCSSTGRIPVYATGLSLLKMSQILSPKVVPIRGEILSHLI